MCVSIRVQHNWEHIAKSQTNHTDMKMPNNLDLQYVIVHVLTSVVGVHRTLNCVFSSVHVIGWVFKCTVVCQVCVHGPTSLLFWTASQFYLQPQSRPPWHRTASQRPCFGMCWKTSALSFSQSTLS